MRQKLKNLWIANGLTNPDFVYEIIRREYTPRVYHNLRHIEECLKEFDGLKHLAENPLCLELAIWFHDIIYKTGTSNNEEQSAIFASVSLINSGLSPVDANLVSKLIKSTEKHNPTTNDEKILSDVDLSILGSQEQRFLEYCQAIQREYLFRYEPEEYKRKRTSVMQGFLERPNIFYFLTDREQIARENIKREIKRLN